MKKVFSIIIVLLLALVLVGCKQEDTYTQAEVDDLLYVLEHEIVRLETRDDELYSLLNNYYSKEELDEIFDLDANMPTVQDFADFIDDFEDYVGQLETRIEELEAQAEQLP